MLNKYENNGKKKFIATTLALAITFSSLTSVSYKLSDSLFLSASAIELEKLQDYDAKTLSNILDSTYEDLSKLNDDYEYLQERLTTLQQIQYEVKKAKSTISTDIDNFKNIVQTAYKESDIKEISEANDKLFNFSLRARTDEVTVHTIYLEVNDGIYQTLSKINECESLEEAEALIEEAKNQAYENMDQLIEKYYASEDELKKQLSECEKNKQELENQKQQIENNSELMNKIEQYEGGKDLRQRYKTLEEKYEALKEELKKVEGEMKTITTQLPQSSQVEDDETGDFGEEYSNLKSEFYSLQFELIEIQNQKSDVYEELSEELLGCLVDRFKEYFRDLYKYKSNTIIKTKSKDIQDAILSMAYEVDIEEDSTEGYILQSAVNTAVKELQGICDCKSIGEAENLIKDIETRSSENLNVLIQKAFDPENRETEIENRLKEITQRMNEIKQEAEEN